MIAGVSLETRLRDAIVRGVDMSREEGQVLVSLVESIECIDPLDVFERSASAQSFYWQPAEGPILCALSALHSIARRDADHEWRRLMSGAIVEGDQDVGTGPMLTGCLAFDPSRPTTQLWQGFPVDRLTLPRILVTTNGHRSWLTVNALVGAEDDVDAIVGELNDYLVEALDGPMTHDTAPTGTVVESDADGFQRVVAGAVAAICDGTMQKVVAARSVCVAGSWEPGAVVRALREQQPRCTTFAVQHGNACFLGATPEWLVRLQAGVARVSCLAGTSPRGATDEEDHRLGEALIADPKNRHEHALVLETIRETLEGTAAAVVIPSEPELMRLPNLYHLYTPVTAIAPTETLLSLVERLHPTPAMAGVPRDVAMAFLRQREGLDRGAYAGPIGWIDRRGQGEFAVGIRSALLRGGEATAFAGCGIVADSDPESEAAESSLKLRPLLTALGARHGT